MQRRKHHWNWDKIILVRKQIRPFFFRFSPLLRLDQNAMLLCGQSRRLPRESRPFCPCLIANGSTARALIGRTRPHFRHRRKKILIRLCSVLQLQNKIIRMYVGVFSETKLDYFVIGIIAMVQIISQVANIIIRGCSQAASVW